MDDLVNRAISLAEQNTRTASSVPWKADESWKQTWHLYFTDTQQWMEAQSAPTPQQRQQPTKRLALYSWNIDFMLPYTDFRMLAAIRHLESLVQDQQDREGTATVVFIQECVASDLILIAADP